LPIQRGMLTRGGSPWRYLWPLAAKLFLSTNEADLRLALAADVPAARAYAQSVSSSDAHTDQVRIAFGGDAALFSDEAMFLGGLAKGEFLREFEPDFFIGDQPGHIENASPQEPAGHVAAGSSIADVQRRAP
jgi:hypothetical protein